MSEETQQQTEEKKAEPTEEVKAQPVLEAKSEPAKEIRKEDPNWLNDRLDRERRKMLRELGAENVGDVKKALQELRERQDQEKTELERLSGRNAELETIAKQHSALMSMVERQAAAELSVLSEKHQEAVKAVAGDDPQKQLSAINVLRPTWVNEQQQKATHVPAPAATAPTVPAPKPGDSSVTENHLATFESLEQTNPMMAANYRMKHWADIEKAKQARS
tara:strand:+ start:385 stop:1044 length:660 start_codon:yes stop_codon:yes gene_type:complete